MVARASSFPSCFTERSYYHGTMKNMALSLALLLACAGSLSAQVKVDVLMEQNQFLPGEPLPVKVRISNNSGETIRSGDEAWVSYSVEARDGSIVLKSGD